VTKAPRPVRRGEEVDADSVRLLRAADFEVTGSYRVLAGPESDPILVGHVMPQAQLSGKKVWCALTADFVPVRMASRSAGTRQDALITLLFHQQSTR
jgi:hypothetical protein